MLVTDLRKLAQENTGRCISLITAIAEKIDMKLTDGKPTQLVAFGPTDTAEILQLMQGIRYCMEQAEIINSELINYHFNGYENLNILFSDKSTTDAEKIALLTQIVETAISFTPTDVRQYLELKKERVYSIIKNKTETDGTIIF